jgi:NTE family protein
MANAYDFKHAVILSGGGAYGAFEVGVLKSILTEQIGHGRYPKITPSIYTGTSVGAINAAFMVSKSGEGVSAADATEMLEDAWLNIIAENPVTCGNGAYRIRADPFRYLNPRCLTNPAQSALELAEDSAYLAQSFLERTINFFNSPGNIEARALEFVDLSAFVSPAPIEALVRQIVSLEAIRRSPITLRIVATNWATGEVKVFKNEDLTDEVGYQAILASAAIPGFFPPQYIENDPYVDGGVVMNTPLNCAIQAGGNFLHVIYLDPDINKIPLKVLQNTYNTLDRTILLHNATIINEDIDHAGLINEGLDVIERVSKGDPVTDDNMRNFIQVAAQIQEHIKQGAPYRKLILHRYHPREDPGGGGIGILNFDRDRLLRLVERGFNETVDHNCYESECLLIR